MVLMNIVQDTSKKFSMSEALPMISALHFGQITSFKLDLNMNIKVKNFDLDFQIHSVPSTNSLQYEILHYIKAKN